MVFISSSRFAPKYCAVIAEIAERVCAKIQKMADKNDPAIPTAAKDSIGFKLTFPTIAVSVIESKGSAIPEIIAGIASLLICLKDTFDFKSHNLSRKFRKLFFGDTIEQRKNLNDMRSVEVLF